MSHMAKKEGNKEINKNYTLSTIPPTNALIFRNEHATSSSHKSAYKRLQVITVDANYE